MRCLPSCFGGRSQEAAPRAESTASAPPRRTSTAPSDGPAGLRPAGGDSSSHVPPRQTLETLSEPQQPLDPQAGRTVPKYSSLNTAAPMSLIEKLRLQA
jgi:hypothetical protein